MPCPSLQRSRAPECTESSQMIGAAVVRVRLQRSRAPECTESSIPSGHACPGAGFNGAVHRSARKDVISVAGRTPRARSFNGAVHRSARKEKTESKMGTLFGPLQRSRAPECTESGGGREESGRDIGFNGAVHRSARKVPSRVNTRPRPPGPCFNGAVHRSARKATSTGNYKVYTEASTEPCTGVHGKRLRR